MADYSAKTDDNFMAVALKRFQQAIDAKSINVTSQLDDVRFAAGSPDNQYQWPTPVLQSRLKDPNGARPCLTLSKIPQHIRQVTNDQRQNRPAIKVLPVDDKSDPEVAEIYNGIIRHIETNSDADVAYDTACENQVTHGEGYFRILTDYVDEHSFNQDILIRRIRNSFSVYMDPDIKDPAGADQQWCFITELLTDEEFKERYPNAQPVEWSEVRDGDNTRSWTVEGKVRIAEYFCFKNQEKNLLLWANGETSIEGEPMPPGVMMGEVPQRTRKTTIKRVMWSKMSCKEVLEEREWAGKYIPVVRVVGNEYDVEGEIIVSGIVRNAKDAQRMYNYWKSQEAELLALAPKAPFIAPAEAIEGFEDQWDQANIKNYSYLPYNAFTEMGIPIPRPERQMPPLPPAGIVNAAFGAADDIKATTGQYDASLGNAPQAKSGIALRAEQRKSDTGTFHYIDNLSKAIRHAGRILVDLIPKIYDTRRVARIIGVDSEPDMAMIDPEQAESVKVIKDEQGREIAKIYNPNVGRYDVLVTVGPSFATKRLEALDAMTTLIQAYPGMWQVAGDLIVKNMDWPGAEELAERIKKTIPAELLGDEESGEQEIPPAIRQTVQEAMQAMQQMEGQLREQGGKLAKLEMENDDKRRELDIKAYEAETNRLKITPMTEEDVRVIAAKMMMEVMRPNPGMNDSAMVMPSEPMQQSMQQEPFAGGVPSGMPEMPQDGMPPMQAMQPMQPELPPNFEEQAP